MKNTTEIVFILDRSGSMSGLEADTIGGFNSTIEKQKAQEGEALVTTILFDDEVETIYDRVSLKDIAPLTKKEYYVRGCTALLDAVGSTITHIKNIHKYAREEDVPKKTIFVITTDGEENSSCQYNYKAVKRLINEQTKAGWEFIFLGANIDVEEVAKDIGISAKRAVKFQASPEGVECSYDAMAMAISCARADGDLDSGKWRKHLDKKNKK